MKNEELILRKSIYEKIPSENSADSIYKKTDVTIACKIIIFDNNMIMAEEVKTKRLFPILLEDENGRIIVKNNDKIVEGKYFIKLGNNGDNIIFTDVISNFDLASYIEKHEQISFRYVENRKAIYYFDLIRIMSDRNVYKFDRMEIMKCCIGYRYIKVDDIFMKYNNGKKKDIHNRSNNYNIKELEKYGYDLSTVEQGSFIGREKEIKEIIKTIGIKKKSVILVGESGCGKTAIVRDIAINHMNRFLEGKIIFAINSLSLIAGTKYRGDFEERLNNILQICERNNGNIILFFDEMHTLNGLGVSDDNKSNDALNILKPYIDNGRIIIIGATTKEEYNKYIKIDSAFARRMEKIDIPNFNHDELLLILLAYIRNLENKYYIELDLNDSERVYLVEQLLGITDKNRQKAIDNVKISNPSISKDILENAFVEAVYNGSPFVTIEDIYYAISSHSNLSNNLAHEMKVKLKEIINSERVRKRVKTNIVDFKEAKYSKI